MINAAIRFAVPLISLLVLGPVAGFLTAGVRGPDGGVDATLLVCGSPMQGVLAGLGAFGLALVAGIAGARCIGKRSGLFCAGLVLVWAAWGTGRVDLILERTPASWTGLGGTVLRTLALEGVMVGLLGVFLAMIIMGVPTMESALPEVRDPHHQHRHLPQEPTAMWDSTAPAAIGAAMVASAVAVWLIAQETMKGQTVAAAVVGGVFAAGGGRVASQRVSAVLFVIGGAAVAAAAPWVAGIVHGSASGAVQAAQAGRLMALARPLAMDYIAGALVGMPMGLAWAESMIAQHGPEGRPVRR